MTVETATQILEDLSLKDKTDSAPVKSEPQSPKFAKRRRPWAPRTIPREQPSVKEHSRKRPQRRRNDSEMSSRPHRRSPRHRHVSEVSSVTESSKDASPMKTLKDTVTEKYDKKGRTLLDSYLKNRWELVSFEGKTKFLQQCKAYEVVPMPYRLTNYNIKNTKVICRILDKFSLQLMFADLNYCRKRCEQIKKLLAERTELMKAMFDESLMTEISAAVEESSQRRSKQLQDRHDESFKHLEQEYNLSSEDIEAAMERLKLFEQIDKERLERRLQRQQEKEQKGEEKPEKPAEAEPEPEETKKE
ncbi:uncharacterized protein LOC100900687 [Galendromus occidentalis]|uniref:Uncharacterized protein LOC100900687 n=1 Tax=Galendromus occidentalis TaxID=34638 RepID=A0AAJ6QTZ4_9ACAR|nr:uncharacterized protein LOC100900687 [Galendromus occidentalis]